MTCNIINPDHAKINGGNSAYGGFLTNVSLNLAGLNGGNSANVTLEGVGLQRPSPGDKITIDIMGTKMKFDIAGFDYRDSADSIPTLSLNCQDSSHRFLDHNFIGLRGDTPEGVNNLHAIGYKYGKKPNMMALGSVGYYVSNSDEEWVKLEDAYNEAGIENPVNKAADTPGKTLYFAEGDYSLKTAMAGLLSAPIPSGPYDATGSFRAVLSQISNETGVFMYWDLLQNIVKGFMPTSISGGISILKSWTSLPGCKVLSIGDGKDFTVTEGVGAIGSFDNDAPDGGGKPSKYYSAQLLDPDFHYSGCGNPDAPLTKLDLTDFDVQMAMGASYESKIYAYYVLQAILQEHNFGNAKMITHTAGYLLNARDDETPNQTITMEDNFMESTFPSTRSSQVSLWTNNLFFDYYVTNAKGNGSMEKILAVSVIPEDDGSLVAKNMLDDYKTEWLENPGKFPNFVAGDFDKNETGEFEFSSGAMFIHSPDIAASILNADGSLSGDSDILRLYLQSIMSFKDKFYVVTACLPEKLTKTQKTLNSRSKKKKKCNKGTTFYDIDPRTGKPKRVTVPNVMGFLATARASSAISSSEADDGYEHHAVNPFESLDLCGLDALKELAMNLSFMYIKGSCPKEFMKNNSVVGFIYALYNNKLKEYFEEIKAGTGDIEKMLKKWKSENPKLTDDPELKIHIVLRSAEESTNPFAKTSVECGVSGQQKTYSLAGAAEIVTKLYGKIEGKWGEGPSALFGKKPISLGPNLASGGNIENDNGVYNLMLISDTFIANMIQEVEFGEAEEEAKLWYDVEQSGGGNFHMSYGNITDQDKTWTKRLETGLTITSADVGLTNKGFSSFAADAADRFNKVSRRNQAAMFNELKNKIDKNVNIDDLVAEKYTAEALITKEGRVVIPSFEEGLESLSISSSANGDSSVTVTVSNTAIRSARKAMMDAIANGNKGMQSNRTITNDPKYTMSNTQLKRLM